MLSNLFDPARLDPRTLIETAVFAALLATTITALVWKARPTFPGFGYCVLGNSAGSLCLLLLSLRGIAPDWLSIVVANGLSLACAILFLQGARLFRGLRLHWTYEILAAGGTTAALAAFRYDADNIRVRTCIIGFALGCFGSMAAATLLNNRHAARTLGPVITGIVFALAASGNLLHAAYAAYTPVTAFFEPYGVNLIFLAGMGLVMVGWSFGFILMIVEWRATGPDVTAFATPGVTANSSDNGVAIPESEVRAQLRRIVDSDLFRKSPRMERFLTVAVDRALHGQPEGLKEYTLGRDVFDRTEDYDPRVDSIVRVEAQRLRRKLGQYYESQGSSDPILVEFNPGSYVPAFKYRKDHKGMGHN